jgi:hypothetical protein
VFTEEYLAGFVDADGCLSIRARTGATPDLEFSISQKTSRADVLRYAQGLFGGIIRSKVNGAHSELCLRSGHARNAIDRLKSHLVLKRGHAEMFLDVVDRGYVLKTRYDVMAIRQRVKQIRKCAAIPRLTSCLSEKWLAGYIDGDGSFSVKVCKKTGYAYPALRILAARNYFGGVNLLPERLGGRLQDIRTSRGRLTLTSARDVSSRRILLTPPVP